MSLSTRFAQAGSLGQRSGAWSVDSETSAQRSSAATSLPSTLSAQSRDLASFSTVGGSNEQSWLRLAATTTHVIFASSPLGPPVRSHGSNGNDALSRLPLEIRITIYEYLLVEPKFYVVELAAPSRNSLRHNLAIFRTNSMYRQEAAPIFYGNNHFLFTSPRFPVNTEYFPLLKRITLAFDVNRDKDSRSKAWGGVIRTLGNPRVRLKPLTLAMNGYGCPYPDLTPDDDILHHNHPVVRGLITVLMGKNVTQLRISLSRGARFCSGLASEIKRYFTETNDSNDGKIQFFVKQSYAEKHVVEDMALCERTPSGVYLASREVQLQLLHFLVSTQAGDNESDGSEQSGYGEVSDDGVTDSEDGRDEEGQGAEGQEGADDAGTTNGKRLSG